MQSITYKSFQAKETMCRKTFETRRKASLFLFLLRIKVTATISKTFGLEEEFYEQGRSVLTQPGASPHHAKWHQGGRRMKGSKMMSYIMHYQAALKQRNSSRSQSLNPLFSPCNPTNICCFSLQHIKYTGDEV